MSPSSALNPDLLTGQLDAVEAASAELEALDAAAALQICLDAFGTRAIVGTAFGAGGLCVLHLAQQIDPEVAVYTIDTGFMFPETVALAERWVQERQLRLRRMLPVLTPQQQAAEYGEALWSSDPDKCCALRKVEPNQRALAEIDLWVTALRRDESPSRAAQPVLQRTKLASGRPILKLAPIARWSRQDVWRYIFQHDLPYNPMHDAGYPSVGCTHCTTAVAEGGDERDGRWAGKSKNECGLHLGEVE